MVAPGHVGLVAEPFADVEGALVVAFGLVVVATFLGEDTEVVVAASHADLVAELLFDVEGVLVVTFGLVVVPAPVSHDAELVEPGGSFGGPVWQQGQGVMDQGRFLVPGSPGIQLLADQPCDLGGVVGVLGGQQVVAGFEQVMHVAWSCGQVWTRHRQ